MTDGAAADALRADALRAELRAWLAEHWTPEHRHLIHGESLGVETDAFDAHRAWNAELVDGGWAAISWPTDFGGRGAGLLEQLAYIEEMARVGAPGPVNAIGVANIAPAIMAVGTPEQQDRFLRPMLRGDEIWCQGMSEPDAGSRPGLAARRGRARRGRLRGQRPEDVELPRAPRRLVPALRPHRPRRRQAQGDHLPARRHDARRASRRGRSRR